MEWAQWWMPAHPVAQGLVAGVFIVTMNLLGALAILFLRKPSQRVQDTMLGFAAGVMLTASFTSLILPGVERGGVLPVLAGVALGALAMDLADHLIPHRHPVLGREGIDSKRIRAVWLFIIAITLHNAPEGLAVGVAFGGGQFREGVLLMLAIGMQNIPEGLAVALTAAAAGFGKQFYAVFVAARSGLVELPAAVLGAMLVYLFAPTVPYAMGFAAGAMLYIISDEIVPETHRKGHERWATFGLMAGLMLMLYLDIVLGG
ncbi:MAG: ZIP family metal transporter [Fimbriimonadales bacterium]|nr:MAG: ZIP family metal transporter [Fimbriimonadales bacterium]